MEVGGIPDFFTRSHTSQLASWFCGTVLGTCHSHVLAQYLNLAGNTAEFSILHAT